MRKCSLHTLMIAVSLMFESSLCLEVGTKILTGFKMNPDCDVALSVRAAGKEVQCRQS